jgi:predicted ATPase/DNA-binding winged helix-turn-helix (wHTH) protein
MIQIGKLQVDCERREVTENGIPLRIGSRAFGVLELLIDASGSLVTKDDIISRVWPQTIVEENNLQVQIAVLRKALGADRGLIRTIPGRGYQLVGLQADHAGAASATSDDSLRELPAQTELLGREAAVSEIGAVLDNAPVLTLVGAGGIGKTSLAIRVARRHGHRYAGGVRFVELAPVSDPAKVALAAAQACGIHPGNGTKSAEALAERLAQQRCLVIFDNAEHVVEAVAELADVLAAWYPAITVLVTSREPLRTATELIYRVEPLDVARDDASLDELRQCPAVQLFIRRAQALACGLGTDERSMRLIAVICRRLDGIPLAIELAAARAAALGVAGVYAHLDDRLQLLAGGQRNALPRHQTLRSTFDWSYALLDKPARKLFRRLGVFGGKFTFEGVCAVAMDEDMTVAGVITGISELTAKSLLAVEFEGGAARYRLSESTRAYAMEKLTNEGEVQRIVARHAHFESHDAFDRALSPAGDDQPGVACEMRLCATLASTLANTSGPVSHTAQLWQRVLMLSARAGDFDNQARAIWGLWNTMLTLADIHAAMGYAMRYRQLAVEGGTQWQQILGDQLVAVTLHCFGMHEQARVNLERGIERFEALRHEAPHGGLAVDARIFSQGTLARIVWIQGDPDRAMVMVEQTVKLVRSDTPEPSLSHVLAVLAVPLALMTGDLRSVDRYLDALRSQLVLERMDMWRKYCDCLSAQRDVLAGDGERSLSQFEAALDALLARGFRRQLTPLIAACAECLARCGRLAEAKARLAEALAWCEAHGEQMFIPELWRVFGIVEFEAVSRCAMPDDARAHEARARECFDRAIRMAGEQRASMWALRATLSLARLLMRQGLRAEPRRRLQPYTEIFPMHSGSRDIRELYALLRELSDNVAPLHGAAAAFEACGAPSPFQPPPSAL